MRGACVVFAFVACVGAVMMVVDFTRWSHEHLTSEEHAWIEATYRLDQALAMKPRLGHFKSVFTMKDIEYNQNLIDEWEAKVQTARDAQARAQEAWDTAKIKQAEGVKYTQLDYSVTS